MPDPLSFYGPQLGHKSCIPRLSAIIPAMTDALDPPDLEAVYAQCLQTCRRAGVQPIERKLARGLIEEWNRAITAATMH